MVANLLLFLLILHRRSQSTDEFVRKYALTLNSTRMHVEFYILLCKKVNQLEYTKNFLVIVVCTPV